MNERFSVQGYSFQSISIAFSTVSEAEVVAKRMSSRGTISITRDTETVLLDEPGRRHAVWKRDYSFAPIIIPPQQVAA